MEYYFYVILIFAIILKLTLYLCWYQVRRNSAAKEVRIIMPDGTTRYAVVTNASGITRTRATTEERQCLPQADTLSPYDNQGLVERPIQPRYMDSGAQPRFMESGAVGPPYPVASDPSGGFNFGNNFQGWKLPKYEELENTPEGGGTPSSFTGAPPPYTPPTQPQVDNQGIQSTEGGAQPPQYTTQTQAAHSVITVNSTPVGSSTLAASAIQTYQASGIPTSVLAPSVPIASPHTGAVHLQEQGQSPVRINTQMNTALPPVVDGGSTNA